MILEGRESVALDSRDLITNRTLRSLLQQIPSVVTSKPAICGRVKNRPLDSTPDVNVRCFRATIVLND